MNLLIEAVCGRYDPPVSDQSSTALVFSFFVKSDLPRPASSSGASTPDDSVISSPSILILDAQLCLFIVALIN